MSIITIEQSCDIIFMIGITTQDPFVTAYTYNYTPGIKNVYPDSCRACVLYCLLHMSAVFVLIYRWNGTTPLQVIQLPAIKKNEL